MIVVATEQDLEHPRRLVDRVPGLTTHVTKYFGKDVGEIFALAFIVEQAPGQIGGAHFHSADQFQMVVGGSGYVGKERVEPVSVHYAERFSPYGPIKTEQESLRWFTLRNMRDPGGEKWMPQEREQLKAAGRKPRVVIGKPEIPMQTDGLGVWRHRLEPGSSIVGESPATGRGQYWIALGGTGIVAGHTFAAESLLFAAPDEPPVTVQAGTDGFDVVALQFPRHNA